MDIRELTDTYSVSAQIAPEDVPAIQAAGFDTVVCNRPDGEVPPDLQSQALRSAVESAGMTFVENAVEMPALTEEIVSTQAQAASTGKKVLAYCRSGTRSAVVWMLGAAENETPDELLRRAEAAGYSLDGLRPQLEAIYAAAGRR